MHVVSVCLHYGKIIWLPWQRPLTNWKIRYISISCTWSAFIWWKYCENLSSKSWDIQRNTLVFWPSRTWRSQMSSVISRVTWQKFTKFLHDIATSSPLLTRTLDSDIAIRFWTIVQRMQVVSVGVCDFLPKSIDCYGNVPRQIGKQGTDLLSALKALSYGEKIVKISTVFPDIFD